MVKVFLTYTVGAKVDRIRAEKETEAEAIDVLFKVLSDVKKNDVVNVWMITSLPVQSVSSYDLVE